MCAPAPVDAIVLGAAAVEVACPLAVLGGQVDRVAHGAVTYPHEDMHRLTLAERRTSE